MRAAFAARGSLPVEPAAQVPSLARMADDPKPAASASLPTDETWKPEPRHWSWKDLFTSPMLAFKPTCMLVSGLTLAAISALWHFGFARIEIPPDAALAHYLVTGGFIAATLAIFGLGATLVAVFFKADLIDDEFLSVGEGLAQFASRALPAVLVPLSLFGILIGLYAGFLYLPGLLGSVPYAGPILYAVFYPIAFALAVFVVLVLIASILGMFLFPGIVAARRHGWFDNLVDTVEAVGTKPHVIIASLVVTGLIIWAMHQVAGAGMQVLKNHLPAHLPGTSIRDTERRASGVSTQLYTSWYENGQRTMAAAVPGLAFAADPAGLDWQRSGSGSDGATGDAFTDYGPGVLTGIWQTLFLVLISGYAMNLFIAGGLLTYLHVREDDYWDDEDLEDLDKLAKELEEEAKRESEAEAAKAAPPAPAAPASPA